MKKRVISISVILGAVLFYGACGGKPSAEKPAPAAPAAAPAQPAAPETGGLRSISDFASAWNALYSQNEKAINEYQGMPILDLLAPATSFITSVQFDIMNPTRRDGRFEGKLMMAGFKGFLQQSGPKLTFGYDDTYAKDGFGPLAKAGDRVVGNGTLNLDQGYYVCELYTERAGQKIKRNHTEFKRLGDGSMMAIALDGQSINFRGQAELKDEAVFLHNGPGRYDFVVAKAATGPEFQVISFADQGELTKEKALELLKAAGYTIETSGGIRDGKLVLDAK